MYFNDDAVAVPAGASGGGVAGALAGAVGGFFVGGSVGALVGAILGYKATSSGDTTPAPGQPGGRVVGPENTAMPIVGVGPGDINDKTAITLLKALQADPKWAASGGTTSAILPPPPAPGVVAPPNVVLDDPAPTVTFKRLPPTPLGPPSGGGNVDVPSVMPVPGVVGPTNVELTPQPVPMPIMIQATQGDTGCPTGKQLVPEINFWGQVTPGKYICKTAAINPYQRATILPIQPSLGDVFLTTRRRNKRR